MLYIQQVKATKMSVRKDHLTAIIGTDITNNCRGGVKLSWKAVLTGMSSQNSTMWVVLKFCRRKGGTKSEQIQATAKHKPELHQKTLTVPIMVYQSSPTLTWEEEEWTDSHPSLGHTHKHLDYFQSKFFLCKILLNGFPKRLYYSLWDWLFLLGIRGHVVIC